jgi:hypothetical protein
MEGAVSNGRGSGYSAFGFLVPGLIAMLVGAGGAALIRGLGNVPPPQQERVLKFVGLGAVAGVILPVGLYLLMKRRAAVPGRAGLIVLAAAGAALVAFYLSWVSYYVEFPADILSFSEGNFFNDMVKVRTGHAIYTAQQNNESMPYTPGAPIFTHAVAWAFGVPDSIPAYRMIQLTYTFGAAVFAVLCYVRLMQLSGHTRFAVDRVLWGAIALPLFFLIATNSFTNLFTHNLHNDALTQLIALVSYWLLLEYIMTRRLVVLVLMAVIPAAGFLVKQPLAIWAPLYCGHLLFFDSPRSWLRSVSFGVTTFAILAAVFTGCYLLWGEPFWYYVVVVNRSYPVPFLRSIQHGLVVWVFYAVGFVGALVLLRGAAISRLIGPWVIWLLFFGVETYTSGINVTLNHLGPGCLIAGIWFLAAVTRLWPAHQRIKGMPRRPLLAWARTGLAVGLVGLVYAGLGIVSMPVSSLPLDAYRYVEEIEREVAGLPADKVLIDLGGGWIPSRKGIVTKDSAPCVGSRGEGPVGLGDFSGLLGRLERHDYQKILVRNLDARNFWYDGHRSAQPLGIRKAFRDNYREVGRIKSVKGERRFLLVSYEPLEWPGTRYGFEEVSILVPKTAAGPARVGRPDGLDGSR